MAGKGYIYKLGYFVFNAEGPAPQTVSRSNEYRWAALDRLVRRPAHQWVGMGMDTFTFEGTIYPSYNPYGNRTVVGIRTIDEIRRLAEQGLPHELTDGLGSRYGRWVIKSITEKREVFFENGAPRKQGFTMEIARYGEDDAGERSIIYGQGTNGSGTFRTPRIPSRNASPGANSPAVIKMTS